MNFFRGRKLKVCFCVNYLYSNELTGHVDLSDFKETWAKSLSHITASKCVRLLRQSKYFFRDAPLSNNGQKNSYCAILKGISKVTNRNIGKASHTFLARHVLSEIV